MEIYLDNSATTKPFDEAIEACVYAMKEEYGNPSSLHKRGFLAEKLLDSSKIEISKALVCQPNEIYFTSGATESNNLAIIGAANAHKRKGNKIITSAIEHPSVKEAMAYLSSQGFEIIEVMPNKNGKYDIIDFINLVDEKTILISLMYVNNETGLILPVFDIAKKTKIKNPNVIIHVDAVQAFMKIPIKLKNSFIDLMSISGHKVYAPKGIGALYIKKGVRILSQTYGGAQQGGIRSGTESIPLISAFSAAVKKQNNNIKENLEHYKNLKDYLIKKLKEIEDVKINSCEDSAPHIINISVDKIRSEVMLHYLEQFYIYVSSGSACSRGKQSYVLTALGFEKDRIDTSIRISFGLETTNEMLDVFVDKLKDGINTLAKIK